MRHRTVVALVLAGILSALGGTACSRAKPVQRIILIVVDALRRDHLSCYGSSKATANIDQLAESGQIFSNAVASFHQTTMSMGAMFTGHTPSIEFGKNNRVLSWNGRTWCGLTRFAGPSEEQGCIPESVTTLPEVLREAGYWTIGITSNALLFKPSGFERGFDDWVELVGRVRTSQVNTAVVEALARRPRDKFFLYVHYMDVHDYRRAIRTYSRSLALLDEGVGQLLHALEEQRLLEGAVIVFTSDHGEHLRETHFVRASRSHMGNPSFEEVLRVPLIVSPARFEDTSRLVRGQDVFQLVTELAGLRIDIAQELEPDELFLTEQHWRTYRKGRWKSFMTRQRAKHYLVDLVEDPGEQRDVAHANPSIVAAHRERVTALAPSLAASSPPPSELTAEDRERLRALGYLD
jgi:arylsulfatase A-like enzyme